MKKKLAVGVTVWSLVFSAAGFMLCVGLLAVLLNLISEDLAYSFFGRLLESGVCFAGAMLFGCLGIRFGLWLDRKKYQPMRPQRNVALLAVLSFVIGILGQLLFSLEMQTFTRVIEEDTECKGAHIVLLMDDSDSMFGKEDACDEAASAFIDSLDETMSVQFAAFTYDVKSHYTSQFLTMTDENKEELKSFIRTANPIGGTEFNAPLNLAIDTLQLNQQDGYKSVIIMLTDGVAAVSDEVQNELNDPANGIYFFTVRITEDGEGDKSNDMVRRLTELADQDFAVAPNADGTVDVSALLNAFQTALTSTTQVTEEYEKLGFGSDFIFGWGAEGYVWRTAARLVVFGLYAVLVAMAYYGSMSIGSKLLHLVAGLVCGALFAAETAVAIPVFLILCMGAYTVYEVQDGREVQQNV